MLAATAFQIANREIRQVNRPAKIMRIFRPHAEMPAQVTGLSVGQFAMEQILGNVSDYVEGKGKGALKKELLAWTEEATILRNKSVDELCSNLALWCVGLFANASL
jgi:hypothetical protein